MKKIILPIFVVFLMISFLSALNIEINKISEDETMVEGINKPAVFTLEIENKGAETSIEFFNFVGLRMSPSNFIHFDTLEKKQINLSVSPIGDFPYMGYFSFQYFVRGSDGAQIEDKLLFNRIKFEDALEIGAASINPDSASINIYVKNRANFNFENIDAEFTSSFFNFSESFSLAPKETKTFEVKLNREDFKELLAGVYVLRGNFKSQEAEASLSSELEFKERKILATKETSYGFLVSTTLVKKSNEGNIFTDAETKIEKNIITRLFTSFSPSPESITRDRFKITYTWNEELAPGDSLDITVRTSWVFPFILLIVVVAVVIFAKQYSRTDLSLKKKITFVKAKGGEFALKVSVYAKAHKYLEKINVTDRIPPLVKLYEKFGAEKPARVNEKSRFIEWKFDKLEAGEVRVMSYVIYSKVGVLGKFALPSARAFFEKNNKVHESESNKAFFVTEPKGYEMDE